MEISVSGQSIDESLDAYISTKIGKLDRFLFELDHAKVHLSEERNPRIAGNEKCEITLEGHGNHIRCHVSAPDKRTAIDLVEDCLALSDNRLTGTIPAGLANLARFTTLGICQNNLTGSIPTGLRTGIRLDDYPTSKGYNPIACQRTSTPTATPTSVLTSILQKIARMKSGLPLPASSIVGDMITDNCLLRSVLDELEETGTSQNRKSHGRPGGGGGDVRGVVFGVAEVEDCLALVAAQIFLIVRLSDFRKAYNSKKLTDGEGLCAFFINSSLPARRLSCQRNISQIQTKTAKKSQREETGID